MAHELCAFQSRWTVGACGGGSSGGNVATTSSSAVADCFSVRKSWSPTHVDFGVGASLRKGYQIRPQFLRQTSVQARMSADLAEQDKFGYCGALKAVEGALPEKSCAHQCAGPGSSALEQWLETYLVEIVKHLPEAPFLQYVPKHNDSGGEWRPVSQDLFDKPENWQSMKHSLLESAPDGIILVHRLDHNALSECCIKEADGVGGASRSTAMSLQLDGSSTDLWGVLVQGRNTRLEACYILKTTQVASSTGILTHFCLLRAKCFGPSIQSQVRSTWLL